MLHRLHSRRRVRKQYPVPLAPVLHGRSRLRETFWSLAWLASAVLFWTWWPQPYHVTNIWAFLVVTASLLWLTLSPAYFLLIFSRSRRVLPTFPPPENLRVAMIVTKVPSEPFELVRETLEAMLAQRYPHDTWLADEDPTPEVFAWAKEHGVKMSSRKGVAAYHQPEWPRRAKTKEGNLAYFYDMYGYEAYDVVVQLDADHVPSPGYLEAMIQPFADPRIGYVSAPSICDRNAETSWAARGRLYTEASMHGSLQAGYNGGWAPLAIGSHYAVRTAALKDIGGLGPELAEDHSTTLFMNAKGWRGLHALDAIAHGHGPDTFGDMATQELQWARSLNTILLEYAPRLIRPLRWRMKFEFLYGELWYPLFSLFMALAILMPLLALMFNFSFARVSYLDFFAHFAPMSIMLVVLAFNWRASGSFRPIDAPVISWESTVFQIVRWPWSLLGAIIAIYGWATRQTLSFRVTPKGGETRSDVSLRLLAPYLLISIISSLVIVLYPNSYAATGYYYFAAVNAGTYALVAGVIVMLHRHENRISSCRPLPRLLKPLGILALMVLPAVVASPHGLEALESLTWDSPYVRFTEATYSVSGAGLGSSGERHLRYKFQWLPGTSQ